MRLKTYFIFHGVFSSSSLYFFFLLVSNEKIHRNKGVPEILPGVISAWKDCQGPSGHAFPTVVLVSVVPGEESQPPDQVKR